MPKKKNKKRKERYEQLCSIKLELKNTSGAAGSDHGCF